MKQYKVIVTPDAEEDLRRYVAYQKPTTIWLWVFCCLK